MLRIRRRVTALRLTALPALAAWAAIGCGGPVVTDAPVVAVALYGRNATPAAAWLAIQPVADPLQLVGFNARDIGVACWTAVAGSEIVLLDGIPGRGPTNVLDVVATVGASRTSAWIDIRADGTTMSGTGVPAWWPDGGAC